MQTVKRACKKWLAVSVILALLISSCGCLSDLVFGRDNHTYIPVNSAQELFDQIYNSLYAFEPNVYVQTDTYDTFLSYWKELDSAFALHSVFRGRDVQVLYKEKKGVCNTELKMTFNACGQAMQYLYAKNVKSYPSPEAEEVGNKLLDIVNTITHDGMSDEEKVHAIHDYLITRCQYALDKDTATYSTAQILLDEGMAQCQGYAEACTALCLLAGVECRAISGNSTFGYGEGAHAWCQVKVNSIWYHLDVTWDDPIPDEPGLIRYDFYLKGDLTMQYTHSWCPYFKECIMDYVS